MAAGPIEEKPMKSTLVIALGALVLTVAAASAQSTPAAPASKMAPTAHHAKAAMAKPRSAASLACSKQADAMKVHGKKRKTFMSTCKKGGAAK
jgi:hypothetical protein